MLGTCVNQLSAHDRFEKKNSTALLTTIPDDEAVAQLTISCFGMESSSGRSCGGPWSIEQTSCSCCCTSISRPPNLLLPSVIPILEDKPPLHSAKLWLPLTEASDSAAAAATAAAAAAAAVSFRFFFDVQ